MRRHELFADVCADCGAVVRDETTHDRFHDILNDHARVIGVLLGAHVSASAHDRYDAYERATKDRNKNGDVRGDAPTGKTARE